MARPHCGIHRQVELICPSCLGRRGGRKTAKMHPGAHKSWGRKGARARIMKKAA